MKRPSRRTVINVIALLLFGAVINVAVAWIAVLWPSDGRQGSITEELGMGDTFIRRSDRRASSYVWVIRYPLPGSGSRYVPGPVDLSNDLPWWCGGHEHGQLEGAVAAGFPCLTATCSWDRDSDAINGGLRLALFPRPVTFESGRTNFPVVLPMTMIASGFIINTIFYAIILCLIFDAPFALRRMIRRRRGKCPACGYPVGSSPVCTECGAHLGNRQLAMGNDTKSMTP